MYGVVRAEMPPSLENSVQKQGRAGHRPGSNTTTDSSQYVCLSSLS